MVEPIMGVPYWDPAVAIEPEDVTIGFSTACRCASAERESTIRSS